MEFPFWYSGYSSLLNSIMLIHFFSDNTIRSFSQFKSSVYLNPLRIVSI